MIELLYLLGLSPFLTLVVPNAGEDVMLQNILNKTAPQNKTLKLYQNNITPAETDTAGTYTEATFTGYASVSLVGATWVVTPGAPTEAVYVEQLFTSSAGAQSQNIYGYFVVESTSGIIQWAERFTNGPYLIQNLGDVIKATPKFTGE